MPYLNWKEAVLRQEVGPHAARESVLTLGLSPALRDELVARLGEVFGVAGSELRLDLPREWLTFWKVRDGESRLLLAHPEQGQWVATIALERAHAGDFLAKLERLGAGQRLEIGALAALGSPSNVEVVIAIE